MAFPINIAGASAGESPSFYGPYLHGTDLYLVLAVISGVQRFLAMYKSADSGASWAEVDAAHRPRLLDNVFPLYGSCQSSTATNKIFALILDHALGRYAIQPFDATTDLWGALVESPAALLDPPPSEGNGLFCVYRPDNDSVLCAGLGDVSISFQQITTVNSFDVCSATWGASWVAAGSQEYVDPGVTWEQFPCGLVYGGPGGQCHLFSQQITTTPGELSKVWQQVVTLGGGFGTLQEIAACQSPAATQKLVNSGALIGVPIAVSSSSRGGSITIAFSGATSTTKFLNISVFTGVSLDPINFGTGISITSGNPSDGTSPSPVVLLGSFGAVIAWVSWDGTAANVNFLYSVQSGATFPPGISMGTSPPVNNYQFSFLNGNTVGGNQFLVTFGTPSPASLHIAPPG